MGYMLSFPSGTLLAVSGQENGMGEKVVPPLWS